MSIIERTAEPTVDDTAAIGELHEMFAAQKAVPGRAVPDSRRSPRAGAGARWHLAFRARQQWVLSVARAVGCRRAAEAFALVD